MKLIIIGAGPGGYSAAIRAGQLGAEVVLIEKNQPGGTCLNRGCIPSKIMRKAADLFRDLAATGEFGIEGDVSSFSLHVARLRLRQRKVLQGQIQGLLRHFQYAGIRFVQGKASLGKEGTVKVVKEDASEEHFQYDHLLIASGSVPTSVPGLQIDGIDVISSDHALSMEKLPERLLIFGGGVIGCEFAQIFQDFGVQVVLLEGMNRLLPLPGLDEEISKTYMRCLKKRKLPFHLGKTIAGIEKTEDGKSLRVFLKPFTKEPQPSEGRRKTEELLVDQVLICIGRSPCNGELGLENSGVQLDSRGWIRVDSHYRSNIPNIWAIGDALGPGKIMLAHVATAEAFAAVENMFGAKKSVNYDHVPSAVFTNPEIAAVGLTLEQAEKRFPGSQAHDFQVRTLGKAQATGEIDGMVRIIASPEGTVLGGHLLGARATSLIAELTLCVSENMSLKSLAKTIHAHPTMSEGIWETALSALGRPLHGS